MEEDKEGKGKEGVWGRNEGERRSPPKVKGRVVRFLSDSSQALTFELEKTAVRDEIGPLIFFYKLVERVGKKSLAEAPTRKSALDLFEVARVAPSTSEPASAIFS